jgi:hypothetical protein
MLHQRLNGLRQFPLVTGVAAQWAQKDRDGPLPAGSQRQHPLFEILAMLSRVPIRSLTRRFADTGAQ